jgi:hypothetical protein
VIGSVLTLRSDRYLDRTLGLTVSIDVTATDDGTPPRSSTQTIVLDVAANPHPWQNPFRILDTNNDEPNHAVVALDALIIFNLLNNPSSLIDATGRLPTARPAGSTLPFYDTSGDGFCTSLDALLIVNDLNNRPTGEGEADAIATAAGLATPVSTRQLAASADIRFDNLVAEIALDVTRSRLRLGIRR